MPQPGKPLKNATPPTQERDQGRIGGTGINKPIVKEPVEQVVMKNRYGRPTQTQRM